MNDSRNPKYPPPDDFSATTPNIKIPKQDLPDYRNEPANDWEKTNYNYSPKDLKVDEWAKPAYNPPPAAAPPPPDFNKTYSPNQPPAAQPKDNDWGATQANINLPPNQYQPPRRENHGGNQQPPPQADYGATADIDSAAD